MPNPRATLSALLVPALAAPSSARAGELQLLPEIGVSLLRVTVSLALVVALMFALAALLRRARTHARVAESGPRLETVDRMDVGARREIRLVRAADRLLVVGITEERMELLSELSEDPAPAEAAFPAPPKLRSLAISS